MKKTLVTGGAGYIGSHTVLALLELEGKSSFLIIFSNASPESLKRVSKYHRVSLNLIEADLNDRQALRRKFFEKMRIFLP